MYNAPKAGGSLSFPPHPHRCKLQKTATRIKFSAEPTSPLALPTPPKARSTAWLDWQRQGTLVALHLTAHLPRVL